jgi:predicted phosphodiesterase
MRLAVFSDIHGNLEALDLFIEHSRALDVDRYACLGDIVGYGPNPNECISEIRAMGKINVVMGNHEWACLNLSESSAFMNSMAYDAITWTSKHLTDDNRKYISGLGNKIEMGPFSFVHASAFQPYKWEYLNPGKSLRIMLCLHNSGTHTTFVGHTHRPMIVDSGGRQPLVDSGFEDGVSYLDESASKILVNPGSIGQPRDRIRKPCYAMVDTITNTITWHRLNNYDPKVTARKILDTDLPVECAYYLTS